MRTKLFKAVVELCMGKYKSGACHTFSLRTLPAAQLILLSLLLILCSILQLVLPLPLVFHANICRHIVKGSHTA